MAIAIATATAATIEHCHQAYTRPLAAAII
jgi:hypothetical protein